MKASWFTSLDKQQVEDLKVSLASSLIMRKRLIKLLTDKVEDSTRVARSKLTYDNPNWTYLQADARGYERAMLEVIDLVTG